LLYESQNAKQWAESVQVDAAILVILHQVKNRTISRNVIRQMIDGTSVRPTLGLPHEYYQKSRRCCHLYTRYRVCVQEPSANMKAVTPIPATSTTFSAVTTVAEIPLECMEARLNRVTAAIVPNVNSWIPKEVSNLSIGH
jgi:hypothetical protein